MENLTIRQAAKEQKVFLWQIAEHLKISEATMMRKLRHELPPDESTKILAIIDKLAKKGA